MRYEETGVGGEAQPDYTYGYADALRDGGVVRPVYFPRFDGLMEWSAPDGSILSANFHDELDRTGASHRLRAALSLQGDWLPAVVDQAHERLMAIRRTHPDAGGLAIAIDQEHARDIARLIRHRYKVEAEVVVSDDPDASNKIAAFAASTRPWLVAVRMVSEGVDIPRLRVGVYASTVVTELFFRQAVGRFVRWTKGMASQKAYVFLPDDPRLRTHAFQIAEARRHVLKPPTERDDEFTPEQLEPRPSASSTCMPEQLSLFSVIGSVATGMSVHAFTEDGLTLFDDEPDVPEPEATELDELAIELPEVPTDAGFMLPGLEEHRRAQGRAAPAEHGHRQATGRLHRLGPRQGAGRAEPPVGHHVGGQRHERPARAAPAPRRDLAAPPLAARPPVALPHARQRRTPSRVRGVLRVHLRAAGGRRRGHPGPHRRAAAGQPAGGQRDDPSASRPRASSPPTAAFASPPPARRWPSGWCAATVWPSASSPICSACRGPTPTTRPASGSTS